MAKEETIIEKKKLISFHFPETGENIEAETQEEAEKIFKSKKKAV